MIVLDHAAIAALIPHEGAMCLLDAVTSWDSDRIACTASSHRAPHHPMAQDGQLDAVCGLEYACQAMATHAALLAQSESRVGYVAVVRDMICNAGRLDDLTDDLDISAERVMGEASRVIYRFAVHHRGDAIVCGRAAVVLA